MTTPNDAPTLRPKGERPTGELVKRLHSESNAPGVYAGGRILLREAAASLQALEARNKELEGALGAIVGPGWFNTDPHVLAKARAALHPATKTGET